jgi:hypothetical protein
MPDNVPVRLEQTDLRDRAWLELALPASLAKHVLGSENGGFLTIPAVTERRAR